MSQNYRAIMQLRDYQLDIISKVNDGWRKGFKKQLVLSPTGSGKSFIFANLAKSEVESGSRVLILADQDELVFQPLESLASVGLSAHVEKAEYRADKYHPVIVASVQSMCRRLKEWPDDSFDFIVADEADKSLAKTWMACLRHFDGKARICGFTATPKRADKRNMGEYYDNIAAEYTLRQLINAGWLSKICIQMLPLRIDVRGLDKSGADYALAAVDHAITPYLGSAIDAIQQYGQTRKTLVFLPLIKTSQQFVMMCRDRGISCEHIDGTSEDRDEKLQRFKAGKIQILANALLLTRGVDIPIIDQILILRLTKSESLYKQMVGRGTRLHPGKENLQLLDCLYQSNNHLICRPACLVATSDEEQEEMTKILEAGGSHNLLDAQAKAISVREETLRKRLEAVANRRAQYISAEQFAMQYGDFDLAEFEPCTAWEKEPMSEQQAKYIEEANINPETVTGKAHASLLLDHYFKEKNKKKWAQESSTLASRNQRYVMFQAGWHAADGRDAWKATVREAKDFFIKRNKEKKQPQFAWE